jgi:amino acid adenylation domain-containing protein
MTAPRSATLLSLLADGARNHPARCAIRDQRGEVSYRELLASVLELAARLRQAGGRPADRGRTPEEPSDPAIVVSLPPGRDAIAACIAATCVGVYVPLDVTHPAERRQAVLDAVRPGILLHAGPPDLQAARSVSPGPEAARPMTAPCVPVPPAPRPGALAYIIHTSGSTGVPKGVMLRHAGLANVISEQRRLLPLPAGSRILQASSMAFDASVFEIALALGSAGTLVVPGRSVAQIQAAITEADCAVLTPSLIRQLSERETAGLRLLISAGEALAWPDLGGVSPSARVVNAYGPTETTIWATLHDLGAARACGRDHEEPPPIGRPLRGLDAAIDAGDGLSHYGPAQGELCLSGVGLAAGYYRRPAETADSFVFMRGRRWYRTGDVVRRDREGQLHYLHRLDAQVKVAGHRIELGEVEACARDVAGVSAAAAIAVPDPVQNNRIELFIVGRASTDPVPGEVSARAAARPPAEPELVAAVRSRTHAALPAVMRPSRIHLIAAMPLTTSGKADRGALRGMARPDAGRPGPANGGAARPGKAASSAPPAGLIGLIAALAAEVLDLPLDEVDVRDDLAVLGGSSLAALELAGRLSRHLGHDIDVELVVGSASLAELAAQVERRIQAEQVRPVTPSVAASGDATRRAGRS